jgi:alpha-tubulin suppressor-like RCC1 family protein
LINTLQNIIQVSAGGYYLNCNQNGLSEDYSLALDKFGNVYSFGINNVKKLFILVWTAWP